MTEVHRAAFLDLDGRTLYALLRLRVDVFVVEQDCAYPELDGRDVAPGTRHLWTVDGSGPTAYLRLLHTDRYRIGRVCTRADARGNGLGADLMRAALDEVGSATVVLDAQSHLAGWYDRFGFTAAGADFIEDGIAHRPMARAGRRG